MVVSLHSFIHSKKLFETVVGVGRALGVALGPALEFTVLGLRLPRIPAMFRRRTALPIEDRRLDVSSGVVGVVGGSLWGNVFVSWRGSEVGAELTASRWQGAIEAVAMRASYGRNVRKG